MVKRKRHSSKYEGADENYALTDNEMDLITVYLSVAELCNKIADPKTFDNLRGIVTNHFAVPYLQSFLNQLFNVLHDHRNDDKVHQYLQDLLDVSNLDDHLLQTIGINIEATIWECNMVA